uniref:Uncharacterized protein n=1 Tax=Pristionchus pacificus TaxID=54126 RepID=A0A2A6BHD1_PRIPA|eukprot:PDM65325.1 hypothetical protein PRIPAC_52267 [Pristionchus pacificus]
MRYIIYAEQTHQLLSKDKKDRRKDHPVDKSSGAGDWIFVITVRQGKHRGRCEAGGSEGKLSESNLTAEVALRVKKAVTLSAVALIIGPVAVAATVT